MQGGDQLFRQTLLGRATEVPHRLSRDLTHLTLQYQIAEGSRSRKTDAKDEIHEPGEDSERYD